MMTTSQHAFSAANDPAEFDPVGTREMLLCAKESIATQIALQAGVLRTCALHNQLYYDDRDPKPAFELMLERIHGGSSEMVQFRDDSHELTDLLSEVISQASADCPHCRSSPLYQWETADQRRPAPAWKSQSCFVAS